MPGHRSIPECPRTTRIRRLTDRIAHWPPGLRFILQISRQVRSKPACNPLFTQG